MNQILGIGNALVDVMTQIDNDHILEKFMLPKGSMTLVDIEKSQEVKNGTSGFQKILASGGSAANTIHGLAMLGAKTGFIGSIGKDETGKFFEADMKKAGINTILLKRQYYNRNSSCPGFTGFGKNICDSSRSSYRTGSS